MISHKYKCIFIHIPKCAGTSIEKALGHFNGHSGRSGQDHRTIRMIEQPWFNISSIKSLSNIEELFRKIKHKTIYKTNSKNHISVTSSEFKKYFKFSVVRNPYARVYSWFRNVIRDDFHLKHYGISKDIEFYDYLSRFLVNTYMIRQQVYWLKNFEGKIKLDYIGKFEEIDTVFKYISKSLAIDNIHFPHEKKSEHIDYRDVYDHKSIDLVTKYYKDDLTFFNYSFD
ncbi:sulfotransferase family protein [Candidatus Pelagibacter sp.]|nr:sulfotransferase family protein [Candidatus Pelagibacter sp.]